MNSENNENDKPITQHSLSHIYTPLLEAKKEIWRRWNDEKLRKKVEEFLGKNIPDIFCDKPKAVIFRFVATPNLEFQEACNIAKLLDLEIVFLEFLDDKFCTRNQDKLYLGKLMFSDPNSRKIKDKKNIINIEKSDNKPFKEIKTIWGEDFIEFHRRIFNKEFKRVNNFDASIFKNNEESPYDVYLKIFSLFICNGILIENYFIDSSKDERQFVLNVISPAFEKVKEIFGINPLIVKFLNNEEKYWQYYPDYLIKEIKKI